MLQAGHLSAGHVRVCGCQLQSRKLQVRQPRRCCTVRAATAVPAEVSHTLSYSTVMSIMLLVLIALSCCCVAVQDCVTRGRQSLREGERE